MHHRHNAIKPFPSKDDAALDSSSGLSAANLTLNANGKNGVNHDGALRPPAPATRRLRRRRKKQDADLTWIFIGMGIVCVAIIAGIFLVFQLLRSNEMTSWMSFVSKSRAGGRTISKRFGKKEEERDFPILPASSIYTIPGSMAHIGDRSDRYAKLRKTWDEKLPRNASRSLEVMALVRPYPEVSTFEQDINYDVYNCPETPPPNYPYEWKTLDVLQHWSPEDISIPSKIHQGLCVFDYRTDYVKALTYRNAELPFVVTGDPDVAAVVERWNVEEFMDQLLDPEVAHRAEISESNHFMYWIPGMAQRTRKSNPGNPTPIQEPKGWAAPTTMIRMTYPEFKHRAMQPTSHDQTHWYFRLVGCWETGPTGNCDAGSSEWLFDELTFFQPRPNLLYLREPHMQRGIHCRFGMEGVTIANHFDQSRNAIAVLGGERRYILSHPKHCPNLVLYPKGHPSGRHSAIDWSKAHEQLHEFPQFANAFSNEVLLQAGDVIYLPTNWFHYIVNLGINYQCNTRSGTSEENIPTMQQCGF